MRAVGVPFIEIGTWSSYCLNCGKEADPYNKTGCHDVILDYGSDNGKPGCNVRWEYWVSEYQGIDTSSWGPKGLPEWPQGKDFDQYGKD